MTQQKISKRGKVILNRQPLHMQVVETLREKLPHLDEGRDGFQPV